MLRSCWQQKSAVVKKQFWLLGLLYGVWNFKISNKQLLICYVTKTKVSSLGGMPLSVVWRIVPTCHLGFLNRRNHSCTKNLNSMSRDHGMYPGTSCAWDRGNRSAGSTLAQLPKVTPNHFEGSRRNLAWGWNKQGMSGMNKWATTLTTLIWLLSSMFIWNMGKLVNWLWHVRFFPPCGNLTATKE